MKSPRIRAAAALAGACLAGAIFGAAVMHAVDVAWIRHALEHPSAARAVDAKVSALGSELSLTDEQRRRLRAIIEAHLPEAQELQRRIAPDVAALQDRMNGEIRALLTERQRPRFEELVAGEQARLRASTGAQP